MRQIKPQSGLLQTTPSQIGSEAFVGVAAGIGFRLGDPRILVHEATVWEALAAAPRSAPLPAPTMPKCHAEWLMMGHSTHTARDAARGRRVDWNCSVRIAHAEKSVSCAAQVMTSPDGTAVASLAVDHTGAACGANAENPVGTTALSPPLQLLGAFGVSASHLAGMGPIGTEWPARQRWMPARPGKVEEMAKDGTHMGWPANLDRRFFQLAPSNQWSQQRAWEEASEYELRSVGPGGRGFRGRLPRLAPRVLYTRRASEETLEMQAELQTVWFLPDHDLGVMWWSGAIASAYFLDDAIEDLLLAFREVDDSTQARVLIDFANRRKSLSDRDPLLNGDSVLMPAIARGWTWELILDSSEHPRFAMASKGHDEACRRLAKHEAMLADASRRWDEAERQHRQLTRHAPLPSPLRDGRDWCAFFDAGPARALEGVTIADLDFGSRIFDGWRFASVRFERCRFRGSRWQDCEFDATSFVGCEFEASLWHSTQWQGATLRDCDLSRASWLGARLDSSSLETCKLDGVVVSEGEWRNVTLARCTGSGGSLDDLKIETLFIADSCLPDWRWTRLDATSVGFVNCLAERLTIESCELRSPSVLRTSLRESTWRACSIRAGILGAGSSIESSRLEDCLFQSSSWNELAAEGVAVTHCSFEAFAAQHLRAAHSRWRFASLDETNAMHADLSQASFEACSMREIKLHGADLTNSRIEDCNLCEAKSGWALTSKETAWLGNVDAGHLAVPRRLA